MPRNSSGNYVLPTGNPVQANTLIESAWANLTMEDIAEGLTDSLDRNGRGGMLAQLLLADGVLNQPGFAFTNEPSLGLFRAGARDMRATVLGVPRMRWTAAGTEYWDGSAWQNLATSFEDLGTAAYADLTETPLDATEGRVLKVGDFGLGASQPLTAVYAGDLNELRTGGLYRLGVVTNGPTLEYDPNFGQLLVMAGDNTVAQIHVDWQTGRMAHRGGNEAGGVWTWSAWRVAVLRGHALAAADLNAIQGSGFYRAGDAAGGLPTAGFWEVIHWEFDDNSASQIAQQAGVQAAIQFARSRSMGVWGPWTRTMFTGDNLAGLANVGTARANLGLGTSATMDAIVNTVDMTANRVLLRGFFGLGSNAVTPLSSNWNSEMPNGWYMSSGAANAPVAGWMIGSIVQHNNVWHSQDIWAFTNDNSNLPPRFWRQQNDGSWGPWIDQRVGTLTDIGSYVWALATTGTTPIGLGTAVAGAQLFPAGGTHNSVWTADGATGSSWTRGAASLSGTWSCRGRSAENADRARATLFQRIA